jgi:hypothetical protein
MSLEDSLAAYERGVGLYGAANRRWNRPNCGYACSATPEQPQNAEPFRTLARWQLTPRSRAGRGGWRKRCGARCPRPGAGPGRLHAAMRHAALGGGKRIRPLLVYAAGAVFGADEDRAGCAGRRRSN